MDNYIVSARKYRPATFESVVGQGPLTTTLKNSILTGKLAHSYLFCGPRGVGKTTCARIFAKAINCEHLDANGEPCNECSSCKSFNEELRSYNVFELDAASNNSVDDIRMLTEQVRIAPMNGRYKVYIIDEVHMLSSSAFNAFLKTLEEPPKYAIFILATTEKNKILPTILSRCQVYDFNRISTEQIVAHLESVAKREGVTTDPDALNIIAEKADGGMRDALSIFDQVVSFTSGNVTYQQTIANLNVLDYEYYFRFTDTFLGGESFQALLLLNSILERGFDEQSLIGGLMLHMRNLLVSKDSCTLTLLNVSGGVRSHYGKQAERCSAKFLYRALKILNNCDLNYKNSKNRRLLVELTLIQLTQIGDESDDETSGRMPKQLKPIFTKQQEEQPTEGNAPQPNPTQRAISIRQSIKVESATKTPTVSRNTLYQSVYSSTTNPSEDTSVSSVELHIDGNKHAKQLNDDNLHHYWQILLSDFPKEQIALAQRMVNMPLRVDSESVFTVTVYNEITQKEILNHKGYIVNTLRNLLNNANIDMEVELQVQSSQVAPILTKGERLEDMQRKNPIFTELVTRLGLGLR